MTVTMSTEKPSLDDLKIDRSSDGAESRGYLWIALLALVLAGAAGSFFFFANPARKSRRWRPAKPSSPPRVRPS